MVLKYIILVSIGSLIGGVLRYIISVYLKQHITIFPFSLVFGTFAVNVIGCFLIGCLYGLAYKNRLTIPWILFTCTGIMGGFTTFSAFSYETVYMIMDHQIRQAVIYVTSSIVVGLLFTWVGWVIVQ